MHNLGMQLNVELLVDALYNGILQVQYIAAGRITRGVDYHQWLPWPKGSSPHSHILASCFVDQPSS